MSARNSAAATASMRREDATVVDVFDPSALLSTHLKNTATAGTLQTWTAVKGAQSATQGTAGNRMTADAQFGLVSDGGDRYLLALDPSNYNTDQLGFLFWFDPVSIVATTETVYIIRNVASGANVNALELRHSSGVFSMRVFVNDTDGRSYSCSGLIAGPQLCYVHWDGLQAVELDRPTIMFNGVAQAATPGNIGGGLVPTTLRAATGNAVIGALTPTGTQNLANGSRLGGDMGFHTGAALTPTQVLQYLNSPLWRPLS